MATTKKNSKVQRKQGYNYLRLVYTFAFVVSAYAATIFAIDSGSLILYLLSFVSLYWAVRSTKLFFQKK